MSQLSSSKISCAACDKGGVGIFKCEGCSQVFCRKHCIEHRDKLTHQLDEIVLEHDTLQQAIQEYDNIQNNHYHLIEQINKWEIDSINIIRQRAADTRQQFYKLVNSKTGLITTKLREITERLRTAHVDDDYVETDLELWTRKLQELKNDVNTVLDSTIFHEDQNLALINQICIISTLNQTIFEERFGKFSGHIDIRDDGHIIEHGNIKRSDAYARGIGEYSKGMHKIRFIIRKPSASYIMSFNIVPKSAVTLGGSANQGYFPYGWQTDDSINNPDVKIKRNEGYKDLRGQTTLKLELSIDCDNRKISYFNEQTKITRETSVDIKKCPLPWQIEFYLYDIGDYVEILSSSHSL